MNVMPDFNLSTGFEWMMRGKQNFHIDGIITMRCNLDCSYCIQDHHASESDWTVETLTRVCSELAKSPNGSFTFIGGEPLLKKRMLKEFLQSKPPSIHYRTVTNGLLLDKEFIRLLYERGNNSFVGISIDEFTADNARGLSVTNMQTILGWFNWIARTISPYLTSAYLSATTSNLDTLPHTMELLYKAGCRNFTLNQIFEPVWTLSHFETITRHCLAFFDQHPDVMIDMGEDTQMYPAGHAVGDFQSDILSMSGDGRISTCIYRHQRPDFHLAQVDWNSNRFAFTDRLGDSLVTARVGPCIGCEEPVCGIATIDSPAYVTMYETEGLLLCKTISHYKKIITDYCDSTSYRAALFGGYAKREMA